jgi:hypothetical protein
VYHYRDKNGLEADLIIPKRWALPHSSWCLLAVKWNNRLEPTRKDGSSAPPESNSDGGQCDCKTS